VIGALALDYRAVLGALSTLAYLLKHGFWHVSGAPLVGLVLDAEFLQLQRRVCREDPLLPLRATRAALADRSRAGTATSLASLALEHARRAEALDLDDPLMAARGNGHARALHLAQRQPRPNALAWLQLLAWEHAEKGETASLAAVENELREHASCDAPPHLWSAVALLRGHSRVSPSVGGQLLLPPQALDARRSVVAALGVAGHFKQAVAAAEEIAVGSDRDWVIARAIDEAELRGDAEGLARTFAVLPGLVTSASPDLAATLLRTLPAQVDTSLEDRVAAIADLPRAAGAVVRCRALIALAASSWSAAHRERATANLAHAFELLRAATLPDDFLDLMPSLAFWSLRIAPEVGCKLMLALPDVRAVAAGIAAYSLRPVGLSVDSAMLAEHGLHRARSEQWTPARIAAEADLALAFDRLGQRERAIGLLDDARLLAGGLVDERDLARAVGSLVCAAAAIGELGRAAEWGGLVARSTAPMMFQIAALAAARDRHEAAARSLLALSLSAPAVEATFARRDEVLVAAAGHTARVHEPSVSMRLLRSIEGRGARARATVAMARALAENGEVVRARGLCTVVLRGLPELSQSELDRVVPNLASVVATVGDVSTALALARSVSAVANRASLLLGAISAARRAKLRDVDALLDEARLLTRSIPDRRIRGVFVVQVVRALADAGDLQAAASWIEEAGWPPAKIEALAATAVRSEVESRATLLAAARRLADDLKDLTDRALAIARCATLPSSRPPSTEWTDAVEEIERASGIERSYARLELAAIAASAGSYAESRRLVGLATSDVTAFGPSVSVEIVLGAARAGFPLDAARASLAVRGARLAMAQRFCDVPDDLALRLLLTAGPDDRDEATTLCAALAAAHPEEAMAISDLVLLADRPAGDTQ
jgi:hypothetical protein